MKHTKSIISMMLAALVMIFSVTVCAFAADATGTITVENPIDGQTYTAYKIFDVTYSGSAYSYTITADSQWLSTVQAYAEAADSGLTLTQANGQSVYVVTIGEKFSAGTFSTALKSAVSGKTGTTLTLANGKATASGLELGYYFVTSTTGALCNLTTTNPDATIRDKNDIHFEKTADDVSVELGQTVHYSINAEVPDTTGFLEYTYIITDTMTDGLTFNQDVKVTIGGVDETASCTITYNVDDNANRFSLSIPVCNYTAGTAILVEYSATVNESAVANIENNAAVLEYTNNPDGSTTFTPPQEHKVYSAEIVINKYDATNTEIKLSGAQFILYKLVDETEIYYALVDGQVSWVSSQAQATVVTTDTNGTAEFGGLENGTYFLKEIAPPIGYNPLTKPVSVTIAGSDADATTLSLVADIANSTGLELPETGGMGTTVFYIVGGVLVIGAAVLLIVRRYAHTSR